jgi:hypothetical protein
LTLTRRIPGLHADPADDTPARKRTPGPQRAPGLGIKRSLPAEKRRCPTRFRSFDVIANCFRRSRTNQLPLQYGRLAGSHGAGRSQQSATNRFGLAEVERAACRAETYLDGSVDDDGRTVSKTNNTDCRKRRAYLFKQHRCNRIRQRDAMGDATPDTNRLEDNRHSV